jgi:hypothetical protein
VQQLRAWPSTLQTLGPTGRAFFPPVGLGWSGRVQTGPAVLGFCQGGPGVYFVRKPQAGPFWFAVPRAFCRNEIPLMKTVKALCRLHAFVAFAFSAISVLGGSSPSFGWHHEIFSPDQEYWSDVAVDPAGNVFLGYSANNVNTGIVRFSLRKYSSSGVQLWTKDIQNNAFNFTRLATDSAGAVSFITSRGDYTVTSGGVPFYHWDGFFAKFTAAGTQVFSALNVPFSTSNYVSTDPFSAGTASDPQGNVIFAFPFGHFSYGGQTYDGQIDIALIKLNASGGLIWVKRVVGSGSNIPTGIAVDADSNIYMCGFNSQLTGFEATTIQPYGGRDGFVAKYDSNGNLLWIGRPSCTSDDKIAGLSLSPDGKFWFYGTFNGSISVGGLLALTGSGETQYIGTMDTDGNFLSAAKLPGNSVNLVISKITTPTAGAALIAGSFEGNSVLSTSVQNQGVSDLYVASISRTGAANWVKTCGYIDADYQASLAAAPTGEIYLSGTVLGGVILGMNFVSGSGNSDVILTQLTNSSVENLPKFSTQPQSVVMSGGMNIHLTASAGGEPPITYQWWFNGAPLTGQTSASLVISNAKVENAGSYYVVAKNGAGETPSQVANVSYSDAAELQLTMHPSLTIFGTAGKSYRIDYAVETRSLPVWITITNIVLPTTPYVWQDTNAAITDKRFYRVLLQP